MTSLLDSKDGPQLLENATALAKEARLAVQRANMLEDDDTVLISALTEADTELSVVIGILDFVRSAYGLITVEEMDFDERSDE